MVVLGAFIVSSASLGQCFYLFCPICELDVMLNATAKGTLIRDSLSSVGGALRTFLR